MNPILKGLNDIINLKVDHHIRLKWFDMLFFFGTHHANLTDCIWNNCLCLPFSLLKQLHCGDVDAIKSAEILLRNGSISSDCVPLMDEMYLQKSSQYHSEKYIGENSDGELYKGIIVLMIVGLKKSIPCVKESCAEVSINGSWLCNEIDLSINNLKACGFIVRAVIGDNHSSNSNAFSELIKTMVIQSPICSLITQLTMDHWKHICFMIWYILWKMSEMIC